MAYRPHLLILACSQTKDPAPGLLPAFARYQGGQYRVVRRVFARIPGWKTCLILSSYQPVLDSSDRTR